jgi:hypothetical protein
MVSCVPAKFAAAEMIAAKTVSMWPRHNEHWDIRDWFTESEFTTPTVASWYSVTLLAESMFTIWLWQLPAVTHVVPT